jgi:hypothetical protein
MSRIDHKSGFGFNTDSASNKTYFIKRNNIEYQVNLDQIPYYVQQNLGLISTYLPQPIEGLISSVDNNTGLIYSIDKSNENEPFFSIFDPVSRFGFNSTRYYFFKEGQSSISQMHYFNQEHGNQYIIPSYNIPEDIKNLLQIGIRNNINPDFILPIDNPISEESSYIIDQIPTIAESPNIIINVEEDKTKGFNFNIDSDGKKNYFITRNFDNYQVNLEQIPFDIQENLGLRDKNMPIPRGGSTFSFDSNRGLIYSKNNSIRYVPFSIFDPVSRYGFRGYRLNPPNTNDIYYFTQNQEGIQTKVASYFLPEDVKNNLQDGIRDNISQDFILPEEPTPTFLPSSDNDPRCPPKCFQCECDDNKKKINQSKFNLVKNNPDPKYPNGCSKVSCSCIKCKKNIILTPSITPRPQGLTDPKGPSTLAPRITPTLTPRITPTLAPGIIPTLAPGITPTILSRITPIFAPGIITDIVPSFWKQYEYIILIVIVLVIIMIIYFFMSGKKEEEE